MGGYIDAIATVLKRTPGVINGVAKWDFGNGDEPSVHVTDPAPKQAPNPVVTIAEAAGSGSFMRGPLNGNCDFRINVWGNKDESVKVIRDIAWAVWRAMLQEDFEPGSGKQMWTLSGTLPARLPNDIDGFPGFTLSASVNISE